MSNKSREFKKKRRNLISEINTGFNASAIKFISEIFKLEKREIPKFETNDDVLRVYSEAHRYLMNKLMRHRYAPIDPEYMAELKRLNIYGVLPKSCKIVLESFSDYSELK